MPNEYIYTMQRQVLLKQQYTNFEAYQLLQQYQVRVLRILFS